jgi:DNA-binding NtrC family response regulator
VRDSVVTVLRLGGHEAAAFATGEALLASAALRGVDGVICAADLPDISGVALFRLVRSRLPGIRFALLMSHSDPMAATMARSAGIDAVFHKPLLHGQIVRFVHTL